ncbi:hypothetical protein PYW08_001737 [Mythimna loreyi]|uniref:Uncharacterized protein n=1 Tax=Mythimna loreyi TaxID=667449 RepID=A0ACC2R6A7_9NEOP|nr:hypothetical protein PYW08_001737 [Mythimna loreyi]
MDVLGYFLALTNLYALEGNPNLYDISMKIADLDTLSTYLRSYPEFDIQSIKKDRVNRVGDVGIFLSNNLRLYCLKGEGNADDEGVVVTFTHKVKGSSDEDNTNTNIQNHSFLFRKEGLSEDMVRPLLKELKNQNTFYNRFVVIHKLKEDEIDK